MRFFSLLLLLLAACAPATSSIQQVTPLPPDYTQPVGTRRAVSDPAVTDPATAVTPTSALAALMAQAPQATATPMPLDNDLPQGNARALAYATDTAMYPTLDAPLTFDEDPVPITFDHFYDGYNLRTGLLLSDMLLSLDGQRVVMEGYMAPPLKPELDYFVLTRARLAFCPFCTNASDWPDDIALVYMPEDKTTTAVISPVRVVAQMEVGQSVDSETGMVSLVRLYAETLEILD
jgi:hypothetical protein